MSQWDGFNRRKFARVNYPCMITVRKAGEEPEVMLTHTENIGIGGVCVILHRNIKTFIAVDLEIDLLDTGSHIRSKGKIVWSIQRKGDEMKKPLFYDVGIEFTEVNDQDKQRLDDIVRRLMKQGHETPYT